MLPILEGRRGVFDRRVKRLFFFFIWRAEMGRLYLVNLEGKIYSCKHCQTHLALYEEIVSKVINRLLLRICCYKWFLWWFAAWVFLYFSLIECFMMWVLCCCWNYENPFGFLSFHMFLLDNLGTWFSKWMGFGAFWDVWRNSWVRQRNLWKTHVGNSSFHEFLWLNELVMWISESIKVSVAFRW